MRPSSLRESSCFSAWNHERGAQQRKLRDNAQYCVIACHCLFVLDSQRANKGDFICLRFEG